jgi:hypothetical protein
VRAINTNKGEKAAKEFRQVRTPADRGKAKGVGGCEFGKVEGFGFVG